MGTTTVGAQATQLSPCSTFSGSIALATDAPPNVDFGNLGSIDGDLIADTVTNVVSLTANSLKNITGQFKMNNMTNLFTLQLQQLRGVGRGTSGGLNWQGLPNLQKIDFGEGLDSVSSIDVENTQIQDLSGINVKLANMVKVVNNPALASLSWGTTNCTNLTIVGNGQSTMGMNITLNSLQGVSSLTINNASALSIPALANSQYRIDIESGQIESVMLPNLTYAGGINVANSPELTNVSIPMLQTCEGPLKLINNDKLGGTLSFPALTQLRGDLNITGAFDGVEMPNINTIRGTSYLWSTHDIGQTCNQFSPTGSYAGSKIQGKPIVCHSNSQSASAQGGSGSKTDASGSSQSTGAAIANFIAQPASLFGASGLFAAMLGLM